ncbi:hypothetical protein LUZ63_010226 [Rhynchospora breviuscula]|uniref:Methyltransferase n=1 Tax=Rhynchospora breviuscula TaxID=2022672 RepID=A0A9Q0CGS3_9POAL|nr:hypothetical protein LUZ63_010226 [Rhynchospora breviuscula]
MRNSKVHASNRRTRSSLPIIILVSLCCFFYVLGAWQKSGTGRGDSIALRITKETDCTTLPNLYFETHHNRGDTTLTTVRVFEPCEEQHTDYTPCQDPSRSMRLPKENMVYTERHCPSEQEKLRCLIPAPKGYVAPFPWPKSRDFVPYKNVPYKSLTVDEAVQSSVQFDGDVFKFPGGGSMFPQGADAYIDELATVVPIKDGTIRTALDTGCGVASFGAYLLMKNVLTMSFAPRDSHEAQVQFALERGVPAVIDVLGTMKLPYPSRSFDMAHCSHCLVPWTLNEGMYMMEVDRVLRPGGYWILSGRPVNWRQNYQAWKRPREELEEEFRRIQSLAELLCWEKKYEKGDIIIWQKIASSSECNRRKDKSIWMCASSDSDNVWYKKMEVCITPYSEEETRPLKPFPDRLFAVPPRVSLGQVQGITPESYQKDSMLWRKHVNAYRRINKLIGSGRYRNIMDMNAGLGSFAAAIHSPNLWVMNVVPIASERNTLGVIYERGLIGIYHDWCEAFSTYPRTYDLIHGSGLFSLYQHKCEMEDILLEMDRILRPEGAVILRDHADLLNQVRKIVSGMRWKTKMLDHEDGPLVPEKILICVKEYWVGTGGDSIL